VAPSLLGGLVLIRALKPLDVIRLPLPPTLTVAVVTPDIEVNTRASREVLPEAVSLPSLVRWTANIAALTCACFTSDLDLMARCITEDEVTAARASLIPGCREVIQAAVNAGCLGSSISGSGPSVFALCRSPHDGERVAAAMTDVFERKGMRCRVVVSRAECPGARIL
ncbi:MAG: homoserine kinase, partial [Myxococcota bacterium]